MKSTITLFYKSLVNKEKNFVLDDGNGNSRLEQYLSTLQKSVINDFQYIKIQLSLSIKIDMNQTNLEMIDSKDLNYVKIQNGTERPYYYFVVSKTWRSKETIELVLAMDTLNCFKFNSDYSINKRTIVKRMHKSRFENYKYWDSVNEKYILKRKIDLKSEEISAPSYKTFDETLYEKSGTSSVDWALYYKNRNDQDDAPVDCYLIPSDELHIYHQQNAGEFDTGNVPNNKYLIFWPTFNDGITFNIDGVYYTPETVVSGGGIPTRTDSALAIFNDNGTIKVYWATKSNISSVLNWTLIATSPTTLEVINSPASVYSYESDHIPSTTDWANMVLGNITANHTTSMGALTEATIIGKNSIDKTLSTNIKIINIPYSPTPFDNTGNIYTFDSCWNYNTSDKNIRLIDFNKKFKNEITSQADDILEKFFVSVESSTLNGTASREIKDSKLFHSDFYRPKFVYDSFSKIFALEQIQLPNDYVRGSKFKFDFVMSRNIVSKFLFEFKYTYNHPTEDYENVVAIGRNNEEVLYNSAYINYIRTGYNYDLKSKERQQQASGLGIGLNLASLIASATAGALTGNPIAITTAIASGFGLVSQLVNYAKTTSQAEENIQRKLQETQMQSVAVLNADDYDLLYEYTLNKAKLCYYEVSPNMQNILDDLFYYGGYLVNEQMIPNISSRYWFNYVQATLILNDSSNLTSEIEDDIKEKFEQGVTFLHYKHSMFDFNQEMENLETFLIV